MSKLITSSLISSVDWFKNCPPQWKERAFISLRNTLARDYSEPMSKEVKRGIEFEDTVYNLLSKNKPLEQIQSIKCSEEFKDVLKYCYNGTFQQVSKSFLNIDGTEYCLYGKMDVLNPACSDNPSIIDIKTTGKYGGKSKYLNTYQHKIYCLNEKIKQFMYLVVVFDQEDKIEKYELVPYKVEDFKQLEKDVVEKIKDTIGFINCDEELKEYYNTTFSRY